MFATKRIRMQVAALAVVVAAGGAAGGVAASASASASAASGAGSASTKLPAAAAQHHPNLSLNRFNLNGYVINADYSLGRNTGNTFQQTYQSSMVQGVPISGPSVGMTFPPEDYVAVPVGHHELYVSWLDPGTFAIVDVFVMNFADHTVFDYAPGSATPESAGTITVVHRGAEPLP